MLAPAHFDADHIMAIQRIRCGTLVANGPRQKDTDGRIEARKLVVAVRQDGTNVFMEFPPTVNSS